MKASQIIHNCNKRIKIDFPYNQSVATSLKQIKDAKWSKTNCAWHILYTQEAFNHLKKLFPNAEYSQKK